jgi:PiT family inorganic phosphate transporter
MLDVVLERMHPLDRLFRRLQLVSAGLYSLSHGANDAQKTMGIIVGLLVSTQSLFASSTGWLRHLHITSSDHVPLWVVLAAHSAIAAGTAMGGWRIVKTMGTRITKLTPFGGFCAETGGGPDHAGFRARRAVRTTHTITGAIAGVGASSRFPRALERGGHHRLGLGADDSRVGRDRRARVRRPARGGR